MIGTYQQLTIRQFLHCKSITDLEEDPILRKCKMLSEITGKPLDEVESMPLVDLLKQLKDFDNIGQFTFENKVNFNFKVKGERFRVIWKQQKLTADQYIDVSHFTKNQDQIIFNIHNILAAICVRRTWYGKLLPYKGEEHKDIADLFFNNMLISQAYPIMVFFCDYSIKLTQAIQTYLAEEVQQLRNQLETSTTVGDGSLS